MTIRCLTDGDAKVNSLFPSCSDSGNGVVTVGRLNSSLSQIRSVRSRMHESFATNWSRNFFGENYPALRRLAMIVTGNDQELSDDLVHETYLRIDRYRSKIPVRNYDSYVFIVLKNVYRSQLRERSRLAPESGTMIDTAVSEHRSIEDRLVAQGHLLTVISHLCARKDSSISAALMILRYVHGYFVSEAALISGRSRNAVEARIASARTDLGKISESTPRFREPGPRNGDILVRLRELVFSERKGECPDRERLGSYYFPRPQTLDRETLSHIVSCQKCLSSINRILGFERTGERHPLDSIREDRAVAMPVPPILKAFSATG